MKKATDEEMEVVGAAADLHLALAEAAGVELRGRREPSEQTPTSPEWTDCAERVVAAHAQLSRAIAALNRSTVKSTAREKLLDAVRRIAEQEGPPTVQRLRMATDNVEPLDALIEAGEIRVLDGRPRRFAPAEAA